MNRLQIYDWMLFHPYKAPTTTDYAYLKIANKLYDSWRFSLAENKFDDENRAMLSLIVAAYFEDVVSYIGLWRAFTGTHKEMYGKYLPFYETNKESYYDDEVNLEDVLFLVWSFAQKENPEVFLNPDELFIADLAGRMYKVLDAEFEKVARNDFFLEYIQNEEHYADIYSFQHIAAWLFFDSYLMGLENIIWFEDQLLQVSHPPVPPREYEYSMRTECLFEQKTGPLALLSNVWFSNILKESGMDKEVAALNAMENHKSDCFLINSVDEMYIHAQDTQKQTYDILYSSFRNKPKGCLDNKVVVTSLVKFNEQWHANGLMLWPEEVEQYHKLEKECEKKTQQRKNIYERILEANNHSPLLYFNNITEMKRWMKAFAVSDVVNQYTIRRKMNIVVYVSPQTGITVIPGIGSYIKDPQNPFYNPDKAKMESVVMLMNAYSCPPDMYHYLYDHKMFTDMQLNFHPDENRGRELVQDNIDFIARFFRWNEF